MSRPESGTKLEEWEALAALIKRKFRSRPDYLAMAARVENKYIFPMKGASSNKRNMARDLKRLEKATDEGRGDLTSAAIRRQADLLMENGDTAGVAALYRKSMRAYARRVEVFEALMSQYITSMLPRIRRLCCNWPKRRNLPITVISGASRTIISK